MNIKIYAAFVLAFSPICHSSSVEFTSSFNSWEGVIEGAVAGFSDYIAYNELAETELGKRTFFGSAPKAGDQPPPVIPSFYDRGFQFQYLASYWFALEHSAKWLPNTRIAFTNIEYGGSSRSWAPTKFVIEPTVLEHENENSSTPFLPLEHVQSKLNMDVTDISFYYPLLDKGFKFDLGVTLRQIRGDFIESLDKDTYTKREAKSKTTPIDLKMPLLYLKTQLNVPALFSLKLIDGFYLSATTSAISAQGATMIDFDAEIGYLVDFTTMEMGLSFGWRYANLEAENFQDLYADADISGVHAGLVLKF